MARVEVDAVVRHTNGAAAAGKTVNIYNRGTVVAVTLYSGETGAGPVANPTTTDTEGRINAWVNEGSYDIVIDGVIVYWEAVKGPVVPVGAGFVWFVNTIPSGFLLCDGSTVSQTTYADLFAILGTAHNIGGEAAGTFRLPNLKGRAPVGRDTAQVEFDTIAETGGSKAITLTAAESGTAAHGHGMTQPTTTVHAGNNNNTQTGGAATRLAGLVASAGAEQQAYVGTGGAVTNHAGAAASAGHSNLQPYSVVNYIVKV